MKKKIVLFSGGRSDFSLLKNIILRFQNAKKFNTDLIIGPGHFSKKLGFTYNEIKENNIKNIYKIQSNKINTSDSGITILISEIIKKISKIINKKKYDLAIVLGDRYEVLAFSFICTLFKIKIAHIHGGEKTLGAYDNQFRDAITKLATLHFASTKKHQLNIIKMGANKKFTKNVGAPAIENINLIKYKNKKEIFEKYKIPINKKVCLVTMHPETMSKISIENQINNLLKAISNKNIFFVITSPNLDTGGIKMIGLIKKSVKNLKNTKFIESLGQNDYFNILKFCSFVCGNSSSGIIEAPSLGVKTLNIGNRQKGRQSSNQTINVKNEYNEISKGIDKILKMRVKKIVNPYDGGYSSKKIFSFIKNLDSKFYD